ncbi:sensor histidine kinase [Brassicibacter mesophilus]|uniref:sensor histidine kinase n=1 Tax=Brassicibacter mesophilus TaxID=745119 RepID=UPI003D24F018
MSKLDRFSFVLRKIVLFVIFTNIIFRYKDVPKFMAVYLTIFICLIVNDNLRLRSFLGDTEERYIISLTISTIGSIVLCYLAHGYAQVYITIIMYELVVFTDYKVSKLLIKLQITALFWYIMRDVFNESILEIFNISFWQENGVDLSMILISFSFYILLLYFIKFQTTEKRKFQSINNELNESYKKLQEYSAEIEKLIVSKERNRVAQEIHDSIGHSLTALIMHLDLVEKMLDKDIQKSREIIIRTQDLARNSMKEVRKAVYALKEEPISNGLMSSLNELKCNLIISEGIEIYYDIEDNIETLSPGLKDVLFKTIKESFTNGIKHGKATEFKVKIFCLENSLILEIKDNGKGCSKINEGNGLQGIKNRVNVLNGEVEYLSKEEEGFIIIVTIPIKEQEYEKDKVNAC